MSAPTHGAWGSAHAVGYHAPATAGDAYGEHPAVAFSHDFDSGAGAEPESLAPVPLSWADVFSAARARVLRRDRQTSVHCEDSGEPLPQGTHRPPAAARVKVWQQFDDSTVAPVFTVMQPGIGIPSQPPPQHVYSTPSAAPPGGRGGDAGVGLQPNNTGPAGGCTSDAGMGAMPVWSTATAVGWQPAGGHDMDAPAHDASSVGAVGAWRDYQTRAARHRRQAAVAGPPPRPEEPGAHDDWLEDDPAAGLGGVHVHHASLAPCRCGGARGRLGHHSGACHVEAAPTVAALAGHTAWEPSDGGHRAVLPSPRTMLRAGANAPPRGGGGLVGRPAGQLLGGSTRMVPVAELGVPRNQRAGPRELTWGEAHVRMREWVDGSQRVLADAAIRTRMWWAQQWQRACRVHRTLLLRRCFRALHRYHLMALALRMLDGGRELRLKASAWQRWRNYVDAWHADQALRAYVAACSLVLAVTRPHRRCCCLVYCRNAVVCVCVSCGVRIPCLASKLLRLMFRRWLRHVRLRKAIRALLRRVTGHADMMLAAVFLRKWRHIAHMMSIMDVASSHHGKVRTPLFLLAMPGHGRDTMLMVTNAGVDVVAGAVASDLPSVET